MILAKRKLIANDEERMLPTAEVTSEVEMTSLHS